MHTQEKEPACATVIIVSTSPLNRLGLQTFVALHRRLRLTGHADRRREAEALVARHEPHMVLLDLDTGCETVECARALRAMLPTIKIIALCGVRDRDVTAADYTSVLDEVVLTTQPLAALCVAVETLLPLHRTEMWNHDKEPLPSRREGRPSRHSGERSVPPHAAELLTTRESHVLALLGEGLTNKEIARRLLICPTTVRHHLSHMFNKFDVSSRQQLLLRAQQHGLLQLNGCGHQAYARLNTR